MASAREIESELITAVTSALQNCGVIVEREETEERLVNFIATIMVFMVVPLDPLVDHSYLSILRTLSF